MATNPFIEVRERADRLVTQRRQDDAIALLESVVGVPLVATDPESQDAQLRLAALYLEAGRFAETEVLCRLLESQPLATARIVPLKELLARALLSQGCPTEASTVWQEMRAAAETIPDPLQRGVLCALAADGSGDSTEALTLLIPVLDSLDERRDDAAAGYCRALGARIAYRVGDFDRALSWAAAARVANASFADRLTGSVVAARCRIERQEWEAALALTSEALRLARGVAQPEQATEAALVATELLLMLGRTDDALALAEAAAAYRAEAHALRFDGAVVLEQWTEARSALAALADADAQRPLHLRQHRTAQRDRRRIVLALAQGDTEAALVLTEHFLPDPLLRAQALAMAGNAAAARETLDAAQADVGERAYRQAAALVATLLGEHAEAIVHLKERLRLGVAPVALPALWLALGDAYTRLGEDEAAHFAWERASTTPVQAAAVSAARQRLAGF